MHIVSSSFKANNRFHALQGTQFTLGIIVFVVYLLYFDHLLALRDNVPENKLSRSSAHCSAKEHGFLELTYRSVFFSVSPPVVSMQGSSDKFA